MLGVRGVLTLGSPEISAVFKLSGHACHVPLCMVNKGLTQARGDSFEGTRAEPATEHQSLHLDGRVQRGGTGPDCWCALSHILLQEVLASKKRCGQQQQQLLV